MKVSRRALLTGAAGVVAFGKAATAQAPPAPSDPSKVRGRPSRALGQRAPSEKPQRQPRGVTSSGTPHQDLYGTITPADLHFERHHGGVPEIDPAAYSLLIHGMVERPTVFTLADLKRFPAVSRVHFLECSGNFGGRTPASELTPQQLAELTGLSLSTLAKLRLTSNGPAFVKFGAAVRYNEQDVFTWIDSHPRRRSTSDRLPEPSAA